MNIINWILKSKLTPWFIVLALTIPAFFSLLQPGYYNMHDDMQMIRQLEMEKCLNDGQIPCRWTPDLGYGYGYPLFNFYPPLPYFVGQIYREFGASFMWSVKLTAITQIVLAAVFTYLLASSVFGKPGGVLSSVLYTYAPYHAVNIYVRGAMNEAWAGVFFPLIFYFSRRLILKTSKTNFIGFALSFAGLSLSHNPMVLTFSPILTVWCLFWYFKKTGKKSLKECLSNWKTALILLLSGLFSIGLTAFFTFPVLVESKLVQIESMFENYYHFSVHFVSIKQLFFSSFWGDGSSVWGPSDGMSFSVGYFHWLIAAIILITPVYKFVRFRKITSQHLVALIIVAMGCFSVFMTHNQSTVIWNMFSSVQKIQFPWRFLSHVSFLYSLSAASIPLMISGVSKSTQKILVAMLCVAIVIFYLPYFHPIQSGPLTDQQKFSGIAWRNQVTSGIYDYLPKTASTAAKQAAAPIIDQYTSKEEPVVTGLKKGTDWSFFNLYLSSPSEITLAVLGFPKYSITDFGKPIDYRLEPILGRVVINLKPGIHQLYLKLENTPIRTFSNILSTLSWGTLVIFCLSQLWTRVHIKK